MNFQFGVSNIATSEIKPCIFLRRTPTGNKVESNLHTKHRLMFPVVANKEIKVDKILQDLPLFTVLLSRALARGFSDVYPLTLFGASSTDYHPCINRDIFVLFFSR